MSVWPQLDLSHHEIKIKSIHHIHTITAIILNVPAPWGMSNVLVRRGAVLLNK
jgi:hypothetical protein